MAGPWNNYKFQKDVVYKQEKADVDPRPRVSEMCKGPKRLESESYEDYKIRMKVENELVNQYLNGYITYGEK